MMTARQQLGVTDESASPIVQDVTLRTPPNWTAVCFFLALGGLHLSIAIPAFYWGSLVVLIAPVAIVIREARLRRRPQLIPELAA